jgi:GntR family transcriptional regulator
VRGQLVPDSAIPNESRLMQEHGVARETARKAVRVLVNEGLVYVVQGRGRLCQQTLTGSS